MGVFARVLTDDLKAKRIGLHRLVGQEKIESTVAYRLQSKHISHMELQIYVTRDQKKPFLTWLNALRDTFAQAAVRTALNRLRLGNFSNSKSVGEGVIEYKIDKGPGYRLYFGRDGNELVILLVGGSKKTQQRDIDLAISFWKEYKVRKKEK